MPPDLVLTEQVPDLVILDRSVTPGRIVILELTVPWDSSNSFKAALERKSSRYERLAEDLTRKGWKTINLPFEVGARGVINSRNFGVLTSICSMFGIRGLAKLRRTVGKIALVGSYRIWLARRSNEWSPGRLIEAGSTTE